MGREANHRHEAAVGAGRERERERERERGGREGMGYLKGRAIKSTDKSLSKLTEPKYQDFVHRFS